ncbi:MAG: DUF4286 family protein [Bacteroidota bacterium]
MIIYNVTVNVDHSIEDQWLDWIKIHIPKVLATGKFKEAKLTKVLIEEELGGTTYSIQFRAISKDSLKDYYLNYANALRKEGLELFGEKTLSFRTELEIIDEYTVSFS